MVSEKKIHPSSFGAVVGSGIRSDQIRSGMYKNQDPG
jgi:hypothetical protein